MSHSPALRRYLGFPLLLTVCFLLSVRNSAQQTTLTTVPAGATINVSVVVAPPTGGKVLSYRWQATDGVVVDVNAPSTTWTLPKGQGLNFLYVLVSDSQGGYTERRIAISTTDPNATDRAVVQGDPQPLIPPVPPSPTPLATLRGWLQDQRPDILMEFIDEFTGAAFGPITTDDQGQYTFHNIPTGNYVPYIADAPGQPFRVATELYRTCCFIVGDNSATTEYSGIASGSLDRLGNTVIAGHVALADGSSCGVNSAFFGVQVNATVTLVDSTSTVLSGPVRVNAFGNYEIDASLSTAGNYSVQVQCEQAPAQIAPVSVTIIPNQSNVYQGVNATIPSTPPVVTGFAANLGGTPIQVSGAAATPLPSDSVPRANQFLSTKGLDSRTGACLYYAAIGAATGCDTSGSPIGGITFDVWKHQNGLAPYNTSPEASASYTNEVDLNLTRNHHGIQTANGVAMYVCNYPGPPDDTVQAQIDAAVANAVSNKNLVACVAMDYVAVPGVNGGAPFTRFLTFGPSGHLLLSVNLDGRGEKFVPGTCVACHGGDNYAGSYPTDGSGTANIGARFLPFDTGNFVFSSLPGLQLADQAAQIKALNLLVLQTNPTDSTSNLINAWYPPGGAIPPIEDNTYVPPQWLNNEGPEGPAMYSGAIKHSCRTCHVALTHWDLDGSGVSPGNVHLGLCGGDPAAIQANHNMPNSKVTFDRMWLSQGSTTVPDQIAIIENWIATFSGATTCSATTPDPPPFYPASYPTSCNYSFSPALLSLNGVAQTATVTVTASNSSCSGQLLSGGVFATPAPTALFNPGTSGTAITISVPANPGPASRTDTVQFYDGNTFSFGITQGSQVTAVGQTITFGPLSNAALGTAPFALTAGSSSGLPVSFASTTSPVCTVAGGTVTLTAVGTCSITASQAGSANYSAAPPVVQSFQVTQEAQTITFGALSNKAYGAAPFALMATASSGLPISFASTTSPICTVAASTVTLVAVGTCSITASQAGSANYSAATPVVQSFQVTQEAQTITFGALSNKALGTPPFALMATASSGLPVSFASTTKAVCTVASSTVTLVAAGTCSITASQAGNTNYAAAPSVTQSFAVTSASQTITFDAIPNQILGISPFPITAHSSSGLAVAFTATTSAVCKTAGGLVMLLSAGTCSITASQGSVTATRSFTVKLAKPSGTFSPAPGSPFAASTNPSSAVVGDFNGDGIQDVATIDNGSDLVTVLLGNGSGGFKAAPGSPFAAGTGPNYAVVAGDFNGDGIQDLATANYNSNRISVLLGNGSGGFTVTSVTPCAAGTLPISLVVGDFNGDGTQDLATACDGSNSVSVLLGNGSGGFTPASGSPFAVGAPPRSVVVGDFNGDGIQDLATANFSSNNVSVLLGNGSGGFTTAKGSPFAVGTNPNSVVVGDFNRDGIQDLATANDGSNNVTVLLGNGSGGFTASTGSPFAAGLNPYSVTVGDFNGDGIQDLATANFNSNIVTVLLGNGSGGFMAAKGSPFVVGSVPVSVVVGDFNGDGIQDLATANHGGGNVTVLLGVATLASQTITFGSLNNVSLGTSPFALKATASSGLPVSFASTTTAVCTVTGSTVTLVARGTCSITASQAGNAYYAAATPVVRSFRVR